MPGGHILPPPQPPPTGQRQSPGGPILEPYVPTTATKLNPELEDLIDDLFDGLRESAKAKARKGDFDYQGEWRKLSEAQLARALFEELLDGCVYYAMGVHRFGWPEAKWEDV